VGEPDRLQQILDFLHTLDRMKTIYRSAFIHDHTRRENDAEHSWHLAMFCLLLGKELGVACDLARVVELVLCHDLVEILAGDTNVYDTAGRETQRQREADAAVELFAQVPPELGAFLDTAWREFEAAETAEAKFARAMDRLQALSQNAYTGGLPWRERGVTESLSRQVNGVAIEACPATRAAFERVFGKARAEQLFCPESSTIA